VVASAALLHLLFGALLAVGIAMSPTP